MVLSGSLFDQFVSSFARANVLLSFEFDADLFIDFSTRLLINVFNGIDLLCLNFTLDGGFICPLVGIDPTNEGATLNGRCSRTNAWQLSTYPRRRILALIQYDIKASLRCTSNIAGPHDK
jgi:hypothetical protein